MVMRPGHSASNRLQAQPAGVAFSELELDELEAYFSGGLTSAEVLRIFEKRGVKLSEGTFRKYVQKKLLPRSKRVGKKGKHQGSKGIYPATIVRQIVELHGGKIWVEDAGGGSGTSFAVWLPDAVTNN